MSEHQLRQQGIVRSALSVRPTLSEMAGKIGEFYGVQLDVAHTPQGLFFVNNIGEIVRDGPIHLICCSDEEVADGSFLMYFAPRCHYAALAERFAQDYLRQAMGGVN